MVVVGMCIDCGVIFFFLFDARREFSKPGDTIKGKKRQIAQDDEQTHHLEVVAGGWAIEMVLKGRNEKLSLFVSFSNGAPSQDARLVRFRSWRRPP